jgi:competence protein ComEC
LGVAVLLLPRGVPGRALGALLLAPLVFWPVDRPPEGEARVTVLDVGQGLAAVVRTRGHTLIYDPGPLYSAESDAGQRVVVPYLRALGVDTVDRLLVTHRDSDHAGGTASVKAALEVKETLSSLDDPASERCLAGQTWTWDGVRFAILHPAAGDYGNERKSNNLSCVLQVEAGGRRMLLTSDIEARDEAALLERSAKELKADVLLVPHHGSRTSSTHEFVDAVSAREAIIPAGYRNRFGHPKQEVVDRYTAAGARLWRTDRDGAVTVRLAADGIGVTAWREQRKRYWQPPADRLAPTQH